MAQLRRCQQCQDFYQPGNQCFQCATVDWLASLSRWQRLQLIWYLLHPPAKEPIAEDTSPTIAVHENE